MCNTVIKRDGRQAVFDFGKIERAVNLANDSVNEKDRIPPETLAKVFEFIRNELEGTDCLNVESIQDIIEKALMNKDCYEVAKSFILYRDERTRIRLGRMVEAKAKKALT